jgi:FAD/FMN-containing dehydrogenase
LLESLLGTAIERGLVADAAFATSLEQASAMWHLRESIPLAQVAEGANIKHDIALPVSAVEEFVASTDAALRAAFPGVRLVDFGHLGDGNLHYNVAGPAGPGADEFVTRFESAINALVYDAVTARGGSISAEHGIGELKREELLARKPAVALDMMRAIKNALDPAGVLNPGRVLMPPATP